MKKWLLAAAVCVLTACSSGGESKTYYQLPVVQGGSLRNRGNTRKKKFVMNLGKEHLCILNYFFIFATVTVCSGSVRSVCCW